MREEKLLPSFSQAGNCRMKLWLQAQGRVPEAEQETTMRTFEVGDLVEKLFFEKVPINSRHKKEIGGWWDEIPAIQDYVRELVLVPKERPILDRQRVFSVGPNESFPVAIKGAIDGRIAATTGVTIADRAWSVDIKTASGYQWKRAAFLQDLSEDVFLREYVISQNLYVGMARQEGLDLAGTCMVFFNKEQSKLAARFLDYDPQKAVEGLNRLACGVAPAEPTPDWDWKKGDYIPGPNNKLIRCSYCDQKFNCAAQRGLALEFSTTKGGKPQWLVTS